MKNNVEIITIGDEILIGQIVDTNSAWMAVELNKAGFEVVQITSVHDDAYHIISALDAAINRADIVLFTGGIGPTKDDITKQTLCKYFDTKLIFNPEVYKQIEQIFLKRNREMNELTRSQAYVPENCTVIQNPVGTAPITWFEKDSKVIVSMPGVPSEMKYAMQHEVINRLKKKFNTPSIIHKTILVTGYPESALALKIQDWENALPTYLKLAYLPSFSIVKLRLSAQSEHELELAFEINQYIEQLTEILGKAIVAYEDITLEALAGEKLKKKHLSISVAESCSGGSISKALTSVAGSSEYFKGAVVAYSNEVKQQILRVPETILNEFGAVSTQTAEAMAIGVRQILNTDIAIATTGIAGPGGGTAEKPVGTVCFAISTKSHTISKTVNFGTDRLQNIERTTQTALLFLLENL